MNPFLQSITTADKLIAEGSYDAALEVLKLQQSDVPSTALAQFYRAQALAGKGCGSEAVVAIREAVEYFHEQARHLPEDRIDQDPQTLLGFYFQAATIEYRFGSRENALRWGEEMYKVYARRRPSSSLRLSDAHYGAFLGDTAALAFDQGRIGLARKLWTEALDAFVSRGNKGDAAKTLHNLIAVERSVGNRDACIRLLRQIELLDAKYRDTSGFVFALAQLSLESADLDQCRSILDHIDTHDLSEDFDATAALLVLRAQLLRAEQKRDEAVRVLSDALDCIPKDKLHLPSTVETRLHLAMILGELGRLDEALEHAENVIVAAREKGLSKLLAKGLEFAGGIKLLSNKGNDALTTLSEFNLSKEFDRRTSGLGYGELLKVGGGALELSSLLPEASVASGDPERAVRYLEQARLLIDERLGTVREELSGASDAGKEYTAFHRTIDLLGGIGDVADSEAGKELMATLERGLSRRFEEISRSPVRVGEERSLVRQDRHEVTESVQIPTLYLFPGRGQPVTVLATSSSTVSPVLQIRADELGRRCEEFYLEIRDTGFLAERMLDDLSTEIWWPVEQEIERLGYPLERFSVVPFGPACVIPFHLLRSKDGRRLFEHFDVEYRTRGGTSEVTSSFSQLKKARILFVSPFPPDLPGAKREYEIVVATGCEVISVTGNACTRERLFEEMSKQDFDVIQFATHALLNFGSPGLSHLRLAAGERCYVSDILKGGEYKYTAVILSACDTAITSISTLNMNNSLADAFRLAGASAVVASLWPLEDNTAALFMEGLYDKLANGEEFRGAFHATFRACATELSGSGLPFRYWGALMMHLG